jgi:TubC N-terminal docking domain
LTAAVALLVDLERRGVRVTADRDRLHVEAPRGALNHDELTALREHKPDLLQILAYRAALRRVWDLMSQGETSDPDECATTIENVVRLTDELGTPVADQLRHTLEGQWWAATGRCPRCGGQGERHA